MPLHSVSISKANVKKKEKNRKERGEKKGKASLGRCISNCEKGFWNCGSGLCLANGNSWMWEKRCPFLLRTPLPKAHLNNRKGHCQIQQETGEWAPTQDVSELNSLHSIKYVWTSLISPAKQSCVCKWLSLLPTQLWCHPFCQVQCLLTFGWQLRLESKVVKARHLCKVFYSSRGPQDPNPGPFAPYWWPFKASREVLWLLKMSNISP